MQNKHIKRSIIREKAAPYLFLAPFLLSVLLFFVFPAIYSLVLSFFKYKGYGATSFVGFSNYKQLFIYPTMWNSLKNTFVYFIFSYVVVMVVAFLLSVAVRSDTIKKYQRIYKPLIFLPQISAVVASALIFKIIFGNQVGVINNLLGTSIPFMNDTKFMYIPVVTLIAWRGIGWYFIIFLSGLTTIDDSVLQAAKIDGANYVQTLFRIIIPIMKPIFMMTSITYVIGAFKLYTEPNLVLSNTEAPLQVAPFINIITTNIGAGLFGKASAAGWLLALIIMTITIFQIRLFREEK